MAQTAHLMPQRTVFWAEARTLILADLHWGKAETFRLDGIPVPGGVIEHDLARLDSAIDATGATRLLVVGDLMHAHRGLTTAMIDRIAAWRAARPIELLLVPGNHDARVAGVIDAWSITLADADHREGPFRFFHHAGEGGAEPGFYTWSGHIHPMARLSGGGDSLRLPCFRIGREVGVLPAFSVFTAGFTVRPRPDETLYAIAEGRVVRV